MADFFGRQAERDELLRCLNSNRSEFVIIYGRRRIGKTYLVNNVLGNRLTFSFTGSHTASTERELMRFAMTLANCGLDNGDVPTLNNWYDAFDALQRLLESAPSGKKVIFIDEMPWIDKRGNQFVSALEDFWNTWAALRGDIMLVACGSATSWMNNHLVENQGGLHGRITSRIRLRPFSLHECEQYLRAMGCEWDRYQIVQCYMTVGGIPYYLSLLAPNKSLEQNIDNLFFDSTSRLSGEFSELYNVLFNDAAKYVDIVKLLAAHPEGLTRQEILKLLKLNSGGGITQRLANLEACDFITSYQQSGKKTSNSIYRLTDFYTLFYYKFIEGINTLGEQYWVYRANDRDVMVWQGTTFELVCMQHINQIKQALGIIGIRTTASAWRNSGEDKAQIDLVIERADRMTHLCEMKFSTEKFVVTKQYADRLRERMAIYRQHTGYRHALINTLVTTVGLANGIHSGVFANCVTLDDLFVARRLI